MKIHHRKNTIASLIRGLGVALMLFGTASMNAEELIKEIVHFDVSGGEVEGLDVTKDGFRIASTAPLEMEVEVDGEEIVFFESSITRYIHHPALPEQFYELKSLNLKGGELTDIAIVPGGKGLGQTRLISNVRDDDLFDGNQLLVIRGQGVVKRIDLPDSADGLGLSPDGSRLVLAGEKYDAIDIFDTSFRARNVKLLKRIEADKIESFFVDKDADLDRLGSGVEPEAVAFTPGGSLAFVSLQDASAVAVVDMVSLELVDVILLPYGFLVDVSDDGDGSEFEKFGVEPDGMGVTPDGNFLITANETDGDSQHLGGISVIDLRNLPLTPVTYCVWDLDPTLLDGSGVVVCPFIPPYEEPTQAETAAIRSLPRIDPNATKTAWRQGKSVTALNIERKTKAQDRGSVLFLDTSDLINGGAPSKIVRTLIGLEAGSRPEGLRVSNDGQFFWIGLQLDGGTIARIELNE